MRAKKNVFKALLQNKSSSNLQSQYTEARKAAAQAVKMSEQRSWEEFGRRLDCHCKQNASRTVSEANFIR